MPKLPIGALRAKVATRATRAVFSNRSMPLMLKAAVALASVSAISAAQQVSSPNAAALMGTYAFATEQLPSSGSDGCWLEAAPVRADSMHLQVLCRKPAPGHHLGVLDARLPFSRGPLVYETDEFVGHCRITVRFAGARAIVTQAGSDQACGFGAFVDVSGTYVRLDKRRPAFDLAPLERPSGSRTRRSDRLAPSRRPRNER
jgi:hypothetical protein